MMRRSIWQKEMPVENGFSLQGVAGGDVSLAYKLIQGRGDPLFLLVQPKHPADFYKAEVAGLKAFEAHGISAPRVLSTGQIDGDAYLLLSFLEEGHGDQRDLGALVAKLHQVKETDGRFGFEEDYTGVSITFDNSWQDSWVDLFVGQRLDPLRDAILDKGYWNEANDAVYQRVRQKIIAVLSQHSSQASLLHGDLWSGNYMFLTTGEPVLFDPAVLYGDREFDIGISTVFGGFSKDFYQAYQEHFPLEAGYEERLEFYRLYFLMLHLNKFGLIYYDSVERSMDEILS